MSEQPVGRPTAEDLLDESTVVDYLRERGLALPPQPSVRSLGGGISNVVLQVADRYVVKQARAQLLVADTWLATRERTLTEARAIAYLGAVTPGALPELYDVDPDRLALVVAMAPAGWRCWKDDLMAGRADPRVGARLGRQLALWHTRSAADPAAAERFRAEEAFDQLRIAPYFGALTDRRPDLAGAVRDTVAQMLQRRLAVVHGDFSPKNVLVGDDASWVIDLEVAHHGDPLFDVAFLLTHLLLKSAHRPGHAPAYRDVAGAFLDGYDEETDIGRNDDLRGRLVGALLLARVFGKSPAGYLDAAAESLVARAGERLLTVSGALEQMWEAVR